MSVMSGPSMPSWSRPPIELPDRGIHRRSCSDRSVLYPARAGPRRAVVLGDRLDQLGGSAGEREPDALALPARRSRPPSRRLPCRRNRPQRDSPGSRRSISSSGPPSPVSHTNQRPSGPRNSVDRPRSFPGQVGRDLAACSSRSDRDGDLLAAHRGDGVGPLRSVPSSAVEPDVQIAGLARRPGQPGHFQPDPRADAPQGLS